MALANAAQVISTQPSALALRYMQTLLDMGSNQNSTVVFPLPIELIRPLLGRAAAPEPGISSKRAAAPQHIEAPQVEPTEPPQVEPAAPGRRG